MMPYTPLLMLMPLISYAADAAVFHAASCLFCRLFLAMLFMPPILIRHYAAIPAQRATLITIAAMPCCHYAAIRRHDAAMMMPLIR